MPVRSRDLGGWFQDTAFAGSRAHGFSAWKRTEVLAQAEWAPGLALLDGTPEQRVIPLSDRAMSHRVMQMNRKRVKLEVAPAYTGVVQPRGDLVVLATPAYERLVEAVDTDKITFPIRLIAPTNGMLPHPLAEHEPAQQDVANGVAPAPDIWSKKSQIHTPVVQHTCRSRGARQQPDTLYETTVPRCSHVISDKVPVKHHVAIDDDQIVAARLGYGPIARSRQAEAFIRLPKVH